MKEQFNQFLTDAGFCDITNIIVNKNYRATYEMEEWGKFECAFEILDNALNFEIFFGKDEIPAFKEGKYVKIKVIAALIDWSVDFHDRMEFFKYIPLKKPVEFGDIIDCQQHAIALVHFLRHFILCKSSTEGKIL